MLKPARADAPRPLTHRRLDGDRGLLGRRGCKTLRG
jgi:hypothetical protein